MALELPYYGVATDGTVPIFMAGSLASRPLPGQANRLYLVTDAATPYLTRDSGASWSAVGSSEAAASILAKLLTVDGAGSGLDADLLDGLTSTEFIRANGVTAMTAALVLAADPTSALHAAPKQYVDAVKTYVDSMLAGLDAKPDVRLASNTNHALTGAQTVDGVAVVTGNRILLKNQTAGAENGIWVASTTGAWTRATDADTAAKLKDMYTFVAEGTANRDTGWLLTTDAFTLGTTALVYGQFSGPGSTLAGTGLTRSGNTISASFGSVAGTIAQGNDSRLHTRNHNLFSTDHPDVDAADVPANGDALVYSGALGKWIAAPPSAAAAHAATHYAGAVDPIDPTEMGALSVSSPAINLLPDSGRMFGSINPLALTSTNAFVASPVLGAVNGSTLTNGGKFVQNNTTNGGTAGALNQAVIDLLAAMGRTGAAAQYGVEFNAQNITAGTGTVEPHNEDGGAIRYPVSQNGTRAIFGMAGSVSMSFWVRIVAAAAGNDLLIANQEYLAINGIRRTVADANGNFTVRKTPADGWLHVAMVSSSTIGYNTTFPRLCASSGDVVQIAVPVLVAGRLRLPVHTSPVPTINSASA